MVRGKGTRHSTRASSSPYAGSQQRVAPMTDRPSSPNAGSQRHESPSTIQPTGTNMDIQSKSAVVTQLSQRLDQSETSTSTTASSDINMAQPSKTGKFYSDADKYWSAVPATVDGMLGGFSHISNTDMCGSLKFVKPFLKGENTKTQSRRACDCGAGIGRITKNLLLTLFDAVDIVEQNPAFIEQARKDLYNTSVERYICQGLQHYTPDLERYDVIWCQWVLGHLTDEDLVKFFQRCKRGLAPNGMIVVKENVARNDTCDFDEDDSSYTRPKELLVKLVKDAGLDIIKEEEQKGFPEEIYAVWMLAIQ